MVPLVSVLGLRENDYVHSGDTVRKQMVQSALEEEVQVAEPWQGKWIQQLEKTQLLCSQRSERNNQGHPVGEKNLGTSRKSSPLIGPSCSSWMWEYKWWIGPTWTNQTIYLQQCVAGCPLCQSPGAFATWCSLSMSTDCSMYVLSLFFWLFCRLEIISKEKA